jgi:glyoxylase-like metal-dependent hydrolase (beta-lactamase superfamily II)
MITIKSFVFNPFQENTFVLSDSTNNAIIVDPGCYTDNEKALLKSYVSQNQLKPVKLVNTHCHIDHVVGINFVKNEFNIPFYANESEEKLLQSAPEQAQVFGFDIDEPPAIDYSIDEGDVIEFGNSKLTVLHVPGHSTGSVALYSEKEQFIIVGDVLFDGSIGRTDLPGGDYATIIKSIKNKLMVLPHEVVVYPGHGPSTTLKKEHDTNPFLN